MSTTICLPRDVTLALFILCIVETVYTAQKYGLFKTNPKALVSSFDHKYNCNKLLHCLSLLTVLLSAHILDPFPQNLSIYLSVLITTSIFYISTYPSVSLFFLCTECQLDTKQIDSIIQVQVVTHYLILLAFFQHQICGVFPMQNHFPFSFPFGVARCFFFFF